MFVTFQSQEFYRHPNCDMTEHVVVDNISNNIVVSKASQLGCTRVRGSVITLNSASCRCLNCHREASSGNLPISSRKTEASMYVT